MDPNDQQQVMVQALSGKPPPTDLEQLQASPEFPKNLSPAALAALFLVPGSQIDWKNSDKRTGVLNERTTVPGESGRYNIVQGDTPAQSKKVGEALLGYRPGTKEVYVTHVMAGGPTSLGGKAASLNEFAHSLGTKELRSLLRSTAETFPQAEKITGDRVSGAKLGATEDYLAKIKAGVPKDQRGAFPSTKVSMPLPRSTSWGVPGTKLTDLW